MSSKLVTVQLVLQAKQDQGTNVGLTFTIDVEGQTSPDQTATIALTMAVDRPTGDAFVAGNTYTMTLEEETRGNMAPAGERLVD